MAGESANKVNDSSSEKEIIEDVHCIVKFRPCKDWRGEYGFDWVREGEKDFYKERIGSSVETYEYDSFRDLDYVKALRGEKYEEWEKEVLGPLVRGRKRKKEDYVRNGLLCMQGEERERYLEDVAKWEAETDETKKDTMLDDLANRKLNADFAYQQGYMEKPDFMNDEENDKVDALVLDIYAQCEKDRNIKRDRNAEREIDPHKWKIDNALRLDESKAVMDEGKPPFEYFYDSADVTKVTYRIRHNSPIWTYEVHTKDPANQSKEAKKADSLLEKGETFRHLDHFIQLQDGKCSMLKDDNSGSSFTVPFYRLKEAGITLSDGLKNKKYVLWKKSGKDEYSYRKEISVSGILNMVVRGKTYGDVYLFSEKKEDFIYDLNHFDELRPLCACNHVKLEKEKEKEKEEEKEKEKEKEKEEEKEKEKKYFELGYWKVNNVKYVLANVFEVDSAFQKKKKYELLYENDVLKEVGGKAYRKLDSKAKKAVDEYCKDIETDIKKYSGMSVDCLLEQVKAGTIDNVVLTVYSPTDVGKYKVSKSNGLDKKNGRIELDSFSIKSWQEAYEDTFSPFRVWFYFEKNGCIGKNLIKYCVPVLSISDSENEGKDKKRKKFIFNSETDAPKKEKEEPNKYKLQMGFKGKADAIGFEVVDGITNEPSSVISVTPNSIPNPSEDKPYELTVEYKGCPDLGPWPKDWIVLAKNKDGEKLKETVGKLRVRVNPHLSLTMLFIKVIVLEKDKKGNWRPKPFSQKLLDCLEDQEDAMRNTLAQIGIELILLKKEIKIKDRDIRALYDKSSEQWDFCDQSGKVDKIFFTAFFEQNKSFSPYYKWCYYTFFFDTDDKRFKGGTGAYSYIYESELYPNIKFPRTIASGNVGMTRTNAYLFSHEVLHRLGNPHTFQLNNREYSFPFCFQIGSSSNIMDYYTLTYSLHQYQWSNILTETRSKIEESVRLERHERIEARKKRQKTKKVIGNKKK